MAKQIIKKPSKIDKESKKDTKKSSKKEVKKIAKKEVIKQTSIKVKVKKVKPKMESKAKKPIKKIEKKTEPIEQIAEPAIIKSGQKHHFQDRLDNIKAVNETDKAGELPIDIIRESKEDREKKTLMWGGVSIFMIITVVIWIYNFQIMVQAPKKTDTTFREFGNVKNDFTDNMKEVKMELQKIREQLNQEELASINSETVATTSQIFGTSTKKDTGASTTEPSIPPTEINKLKTILEDKNQSFPE